MLLYLREVQNRIFVLSFCWLFTFILIYTYKEILFFEILELTTSKSFPTLSIFIFTNVMEIFQAYIHLAIFLCNQILFLFSFYNFLAFLGPGLYYNEYKHICFYFISFTIFSTIFFICLSKFLVPIVWDFFLNFQTDLIEKEINLEFKAKVSEYFVFFKIVYYYCNLQFQFVLFLILILNYFGTTKYFFKKYRKFFYLIFLVLGTLVTPPDVYSQIFLYLSLIIVFELKSFLRFCFLNLEAS